MSSCTQAIDGRTRPCRVFVLWPQDVRAKLKRALEIRERIGRAAELREHFAEGVSTVGGLRVAFSEYAQLDLVCTPVLLGCTLEVSGAPMHVTHVVERSSGHTMVEAHRLENGERTTEMLERLVELTEFGVNSTEVRMAAAGVRMAGSEPEHAGLERARVPVERSAVISAGSRHRAEVAEAVRAFGMAATKRTLP